jgi:hypothetical protein
MTLINMYWLLTHLVFIRLIFPLTKKLKNKWNLTQIKNILKKRKDIEGADEKAQLIFNQTSYPKKIKWSDLLQVILNNGIFVLIF